MDYKSDLFITTTKLFTLVKTTKNEDIVIKTVLCPQIQRNFDRRDAATMATDSQVRALDGAAGCRASLLPSNADITRVHFLYSRSLKLPYYLITLLPLVYGGN